MLQSNLMKNKTICFAPKKSWFILNEKTHPVPILRFLRTLKKIFCDRNTFLHKIKLSKTFSVMYVVKIIKFEIIKINYSLPNSIFLASSSVVSSSASVVFSGLVVSSELETSVFSYIEAYFD